MKMTIAILLVFCLCTSLCACSVQDFLSPNSNESTQNTEPNFNTMYPDDVAYRRSMVDGRIINYITVEMAEDALRDGRSDFEDATITFDKLTYANDDLDSVKAIFWFDITVQNEYGNKNYRAKVPYHSHDDINGGEYSLLKRSIDIWQMD